MNVQELETAVRVGTPIVSLIFEDSAYGVIKWNQLKRYGRPAFVDYGQQFPSACESVENGVFFGERFVEDSGAKLSWST